MKNPRTQKNRSSSQQSKESDTKTFLEHVQELRNRLFWVAVVFIIASAVAYPFFDKILAVLVQPLGDQRLYYLTPAGGFSFMLKVCMYAGLVGAIPVVIYQLFRYVQPVMSNVRHRTVVAYIMSSTILAAAGMALAYFISLPAALHFLTDFDLPHISAMLTADSYFSFVMTYLLAAAVLFQLPLILMIINNVTPLNPGSMMKQQRYVVVAAFIFGAIISPTPDALNQALLAGPIILMYQLSVFLVMIQNWARRRRSPKIEVPVQRRATQRALAYTPASAVVVPQPKRVAQKPFFADVVASSRPAPSRLAATPRVPAPRSAVQAPLRSVTPRRVNGYMRSIDGFAIDA